MFKIEITETKSVKKVDRDWVMLSTKGDKSEYGYAPELEKVVQETRVVLTQSLETLDLPRVLKAINGLE